MGMSLSKLVMDKEAWHATIHGVERFGCDWETELNWGKVVSRWWAEKTAAWKTIFCFKAEILSFGFSIEFSNYM